MSKANTMKYIILLGLVPSLAFATYEPTNSATAKSQAKATSISEGSIAKSGSSAVSGDSISKSGDSISQSGDSISDSFSQSGDSISQSGDSSVTIEGGERQAPDVALLTPNSTASMMKCIGVGGSNKTGAATGAWCWLQRDLYALHLADRYRAMGLYEASAKAECSQKLVWRHFGSEEECVARIKAVIKPAPPPKPTGYDLSRITHQIEAGDGELKERVFHVEQKLEKIVNKKPVKVIKKRNPKQDEFYDGLLAQLEEL